MGSLTIRLFVTMKLLSAIIIFLFQGLLLQAQSTTLTVNFNLKEAYGSIYIRLIDINGEEIDTHLLPVSTTMESYTFKEVQIGKSYAIDAFHDLNKNGKLDTNWPGIPKEPYGFSNNARGSIMGAPDFEDKKVLITKPTTLTIIVE